MKCKKLLEKWIPIVVSFTMNGKLKFIHLPSIKSHSLQWAKGFKNELFFGEELS
jgi:hypothetical protein